MYYKNIFLTGPQVAIGYEDENLPTRVIIDISDLTKYGTGTTVLEVKRPCDKGAYIAEQTEVDGDNLYWYPTKGDLEVSGLLKCQAKAFIVDQIVKTRVYIVQVSGDSSSNWAWYDRQIDLMNECMVYGHVVWASSGYDVGCDKTQIALFQARPDLIVNRQNWWLRDVQSSTNFCYVYYGGYASRLEASSVIGVRPAFLIA